MFAYKSIWNAYVSYKKSRLSNCNTFIPCMVFRIPRNHGIVRKQKDKASAWMIELLSQTFCLVSLHVREYLDDFSELASFLHSIDPMFVFYCDNIQEDNPSLIVFLRKEKNVFVKEIKYGS